MSGNPRPVTPTFQFRASESHGPRFAFVDGRLVEIDPPLWPSSGHSDQHLSPLARPGPMTAPRARSASPHYQFGASLDHPFTFADGWVEPSSSALDRVGELRDALPTIEPLALVESDNPPRPSSSYSRQQLSPFARPSPRTAPRARSASPHYQFGDSSDHPSTFADGWVAPSSSAFDQIGELRDALPTIEPPTSPPGVSPPTGHQDRVQSTEVDDDGPECPGYDFGQSKDGFEDGGCRHDQQSPMDHQDLHLSSSDGDLPVDHAEDHLTYSDDGFEDGDDSYEQEESTRRRDLLVSTGEVNDGGLEGPDSQLSPSENSLEDGSEISDYDHGQQDRMDSQNLVLPTEVDDGGHEHPEYQLTRSESGFEDEESSSAADDDDDTRLEQAGHYLTHSEDGLKDEDGYEDEDGLEDEDELGDEANSFTAGSLDQPRPMDHSRPDHLSSTEVENGEPERSGHQESSENGFEDEGTHFDNGFEDEVIGSANTPDDEDNPFAGTYGEVEHPEFHTTFSDNGFEEGNTAADNFDQQKPNDFSLRVLHNVTPLPSREPSPQPAANSALFLHPHPRNRTSDVSNISDLEDNATPYDVREEEAPAHRFFTPGFQSSLQKGISIARDVSDEVDKLSDLVEGDENLNDLIDEAYELWTFDGSDTKTIAILGDSGEGKSSLINSLLHFPGIAQTGDHGTACTSVVTEYRQKTRNHTAPITIEVEHQPPSEIEEVIKELLWSYRQPYLPGVADDAYAEDSQQHQRESERAWSALEAAFGHEPNFGEEMLRDMSEGALERAMAQLVEWSRENEWPEGSDDGLWRSTADNAEECVEKTAVFMQDRYWPFTKLIRIYLNAQVLKTGAVLADLPGLQDTNLARVRATHDYLLKCNHIFIVTKISRAVTDSSLQASLFSVLSRHAPLEWKESAAQSLKIAVVCTRTEDIDVEAAKKKYCGPGKRIPPSVMEDLDAQIKNAKASDNRKLKKILKKRLELTLIQARNAHVTEGLQRAYASKAPSGHLDVFCVSNTWYRKYSGKGNAELVRGSGVPDLRRFCYGITADAQLREARHFLMGRVFGLVNSAELWVGGRLNEMQTRGGGRRDGSGEGDDGEILEVVQGVTGVFNAAIHRLVDNFRSCFAEQILDMIDNRHPEWETAAQTEAEEWATWQWQTYDAWCRHNGAHSTRNRAYTDWNTKIVWKLRAELDFQWDIVEEEVGAVFNELRAAVAEQFDALKKAVRDLSSSAPGELHAQVLAGIEARIEGCEYGVTRAQERFDRDVKLLRRYISEACHGSYILDSMVPAYRAASMQHGTGKKARQTAIVEGRITDGALFPSAAIVLQERLEVILTDAKDALAGVLSQGFRGVAADISVVLASRQETPRDGAGFGEEDRATLEEVMEALRGLKARAEEVRREAAE